MTKRLTFVLGMHRSGTSAITRLLHALGLEVGNELLPARVDNPEGFFEDARVVDLDTRLLEQQRILWYQPVDVAEPVRARDEKLNDEARALLIKRLDEHPDWVVKDPRFCLLLPFWLERLAEQPDLAASTDVQFIWVLRHPDDVAASLARRDSFSMEHGRQLWLAYNLAILRHLQGRQVWLVDYDQLLAQPLDSTARLAGGFGLASEQSLLEAACSQALRPGLRHNKTQDAAAHPLYHSLAGQLPRLMMAAELAELWQRWPDMLPDLRNAWRWGVELEIDLRQKNERLAAATGRETQLRGDVEHLQAERGRLEDELAAQHQQLLDREAELAQMQTGIAQLRATLEEIQESNSWKITAPLRQASTLLRRLQQTDAE